MCQSVQGKTDTTSQKGVTHLTYASVEFTLAYVFAQVTDKLEKLVWKYLVFIPSDEKA